MMIVSVTGHRIVPNEFDAVFQAKCAFIDLGATKIIQGMAAGFDLLAARAAWLGKNKLPFVAARPWSTHRPPKDWQDRYDWALTLADEVHVVTEIDHYPGPWVYQVRNEWMIDNSEHLVAWWDGSEKGGTWNAIQYARKTRPKDFITYLEVPRGKLKV